MSLSMSLRQITGCAAAVALWLCLIGAATAACPFENLGVSFHARDAPSLSGFDPAAVEAVNWKVSASDMTSTLLCADTP